MENKSEIIGTREKSIISLLKKNQDIGMTITEIVNKTELRRDPVRMALSKLIGANEVYFRKVGMAKVYLLNGRKRR